MNSAKCSQCGFVGWSDAEYCKKCGAAMAVSADPTYQSPQSQGYGYSPSAPFHYPGDLKKGLAIGSLVMGIFGFFTFGLLGLGAVIGIVMAISALNKAKRNPSEYGGEALATAGLVTNILALVMIVPMGIIAAIAIPNLLASRRAANEGATIQAIRTIHSGEATFQSLHGKFATLEELGEAQLIRPELATGTRSGYKFRIDVSPRDVLRPDGFGVVVTPVDYPMSGRRSFYLDETGVIRGGDFQGADAKKEDPPLNFSSYSSRSSSSRSYDSEGP
jgi:type II secretory pathway pseudopilin PulG